MGGIFLFRIFKKTDEEKERKQFIINQLQILKNNNLTLKELYNKSVKYSLNKDVKEICKISDRIFEECIKVNDKVAKLNLFINYYQVDVIKIISQYISIKENSINSEEANEFIFKVDDFIKKVSEGFDNILEELIISKEKNINTDIKIMLDSLANSTFNKE